MRYLISSLILAAFTCANVFTPPNYQFGVYTIEDNFRFYNFASEQVGLLAGITGVTSATDNEYWLCYLFQGDETFIPLTDGSRWGLFWQMIVPPSMDAASEEPSLVEVSSIQVSDGTQLVLTGITFSLTGQDPVTNQLKTEEVEGGSTNDLRTYSIGADCKLTLLSTEPDQFVHYWTMDVENTCIQAELSTVVLRRNGGDQLQLAQGTEYDAFLIYTSSAGPNAKGSYQLSYKVAPTQTEDQVEQVEPSEEQEGTDEITPEPADGDASGQEGQTDPPTDNSETESPQENSTDSTTESTTESTTDIITEEDSEISTNTTVSTETTIAGDTTEASTNPNEETNPTFEPSTDTNSSETESPQETTTDSTPDSTPESTTNSTADINTETVTEITTVTTVTTQTTIIGDTTEGSSTPSEETQATEQTETVQQETSTSETNQSSQESEKTTDEAGKENETQQSVVIVDKKPEADSLYMPPNSQSWEPAVGLRFKDPLNSDEVTNTNILLQGFTGIRPQGWGSTKTIKYWLTLKVVGKDSFMPFEKGQSWGIEWHWPVPDTTDEYEHFHLNVENNSIKLTQSIQIAAIPNADDSSTKAVDATQEVTFSQKPDTALNETHYEIDLSKGEIELVNLAEATTSTSDSKSNQKTATKSKNYWHLQTAASKIEPATDANPYGSATFTLRRGEGDELALSNGAEYSDIDVKLLRQDDALAQSKVQINWATAEYDVVIDTSPKLPLRPLETQSLSSACGKYFATILSLVSLTGLMAL